MAEYEILVTPQELETASGEFDSIRGEIKSLTGNMMTLIQETSSVWKGDAQGAYVDKFQQLQDDMDRIDGKINEHVSDLKYFATTYSEAEQDNLSIIRELKDNILQ